ncbi:MAG: helix-turn-helix domain-containing protein [Candidatus Omnitrophica bacterium]|nr:helix-turn-helix domain-containing protein [Candidatus Omnitrophota bacterium]MDD5611005.1 helix-turn-helix domain-containing protein [Candidatus Omnitrophota bacterium]
MGMREKYKSVLEMVRSISKEDSYKELADKQIKGKSLAKFLFYLRCRHGLSQKELANKVGCSQSRVSKIEHSFDKDLTIQDLLDYGKVLNLQLEIGYRHPSVKIIDLIKYHAFKIRSYLNQLNGLAKDDEALLQGIKNTYFEIFFNLNKIISEALIKLDFKQKVKKIDMSTIHVSAPIEKNKLEQLAEQAKKEDPHLNMTAGV